MVLLFSIFQMHSGVYWLIFLWHVQACCGSDRVHSSIAIILKVRKENYATCLQNDEELAYFTPNVAWRSVKHDFTRRNTRTSHLNILVAPTNKPSNS
jgi:hypothetical protein